LASRIGCRNNPAWEQKFRAVPDMEMAKTAPVKGTKSALKGEIAPARATG
jgi:hypothetical protein